MKTTLKKVVSVIVVIVIIMLTVAIPMVHTHTCHDADCVTTYTHNCHDIDCVYYLVINKYKDLFSLLLSTLVFFYLIGLRDSRFEFKISILRYSYNSLVKQKVKLSN